MAGLNYLKRSSNFELLRVISIILILLMHANSQKHDDVIPLNNFIGHLIAAMGNIGVSLFILLSGYFSIKFKLHRFLQLIWLTTLYTVFCYLVNNDFSINMGLIQSILVVPLYNNWFISCYLILMLISPWLNDYIEHLSKVRHRSLLLVLFVVFSLLPTMFNTPFYTVVTGGGKCLIYFIFVYLIGRYLKWHCDVNFKKKYTFGLYILMTVIIVSLNIGVGYVFQKKCYIYAMDCSPFILVSSLSVFYLFKSLTIRSQIINSIASSILAVYLLDAMRFFVDENVVCWSDKAGSCSYIFYLIIGVIMTFIIAFAIDKLRVFLFGHVENKIIDKIIARFPIVDNMINSNKYDSNSK